MTVVAANPWRSFPVAAAFCLGAAVAMMPAAALGQRKNIQFQPPVIATPAAMIESTHRMSETIRRIVGSRLATEPASAVPQFAIGYAADPKLASAADMIDAYAAQTAAAKTTDPLLWNAWVDLTGGYTDDDHAITGFEGPLTTITIGGDRKIGDRAVIGVMANFERSDFETRFGPGKLDSEAVGFGAYGGVALTNHLVADASFVWKNLDNFRAFRTVSADFNSERWQAAANLTGYWYAGAWRLSPKMGVAWSREDQDAYADRTRTIAAPDQRITTTTLSAGMEIGHTFALANGGSIEPWLGAAVTWNDVNLDPAPRAGSPSPDDEYGDVRLSGGLNSQLSESLSLALRVDVNGIARDNFLSTTVGGRIAIRF